MTRAIDQEGFLHRHHGWVPYRNVGETVLRDTVASLPTSCGGSLLRHHGWGPYRDMGEECAQRTLDLPCPSVLGATLLTDCNGALLSSHGDKNKPGGHDQALGTRTSRGIKNNVWGRKNPVKIGTSC